MTRRPSPDPARFRQRGRARRPAAPAEPYLPPCPHYPNCIGCPFSGLPYAEQLRRKREAVARALGQYSSLAGIEVPGVVASPRIFGYRARVKLVVRRTRGEPAAGLYVPGTHRVMDVSECPVHPEPVNRVVAYIKRKIGELEIEPYDERDDTGQLRYLDLRYGFAGRKVNVTLVTRHARFAEGGVLARSLMRRFSFVTGVVQNVNPTRGNVIWGETYRTLAGRSSIEERVGFLKLNYPPGVFSQANPLMARRLYEATAAMAALTGSETVADLYCGVGPIALYLAGAARLVCGIDDSELAIAIAKQNARRNGISNCRFLCGGAAGQLRAARETFGRFDLVTVNPPRRGLQPDAMHVLLEVGAAKVIYVSCNPVSLARDLDRLRAGGYQVTQLQPFDMFPQTDQVETLVLLERGERPSNLQTLPAL